MQPSLGTMSVRYLFDWRDRTGQTSEQVVNAFLNLSEPGDATLSRWVEGPQSIMLFEMVAGDPESGAIYVFDRKAKEWFLLCFEGDDDRLTPADFDRVFSEYNLFRYIERPELLSTDTEIGHA